MTLEKIGALLSFIFLLFVPILIWGYFFWYRKESQKDGKKRFYLWLISGWLSVFPVLYLERIIAFFEWSTLDIFAAASGLTFSRVPMLFLSFMSICVLFSLVAFVVLYIPPLTLGKIKTFFRRLGIFSCFFLVVSIGLYIGGNILGQVGFFQKEVGETISFWKIVFRSLLWVILYYMLVGILEELSKFFFFSYEKHLASFSKQQAITSAIYVALWFGFVENILYLYTIYEMHGWGGYFLQIYFLRNVFSIFLHILCSVIFARSFYLLYYRFSGKYTARFLWTLFCGFFFSFTIHALFDIFLTVWVGSVLVIYALGGYFYLSGLFYRE